MIFGFIRGWILWAMTGHKPRAWRSWYTGDICLIECGQEIVWQSAEYREQIRTTKSFSGYQGKRRRRYANH